jgi:5-methyltetrahydrofolate--homocysteine methyltransferase
VYEMTPALFASYVPALIKEGASIVGGCCGTTPEFIREIAKAIGKIRA